MRKAKTHILNTVTPEKQEMQVKAIIDMSKDAILTEVMLEQALKTTDANTITIKNTKYYEESYMVFSMGFDIETTAVHANVGTKDEYHHAYMYIWQMCFGDYIIIGRTWEQWMKTMERIQMHYGLGVTKDTDPLKNTSRTVSKQAIVWIANSGYEFQFLCKKKWQGRNIIRRTEDSGEPVFSDHQRKPISFELDFSDTMGAGFRCLDVLRVAGGNLATVAKNYCVTKKLVTYDKDGNKISDLDYTKMRNSKTVLTDDELAYCYNDVKILNEWDKYYKDVFMKQVGFAPLTSTALIRQAVKQNWNNQKHTPDGWLYNMFPQTMREYLIAVLELYRGGYTHANISLVGKMLEGVRGMDFTSSYPAVLLQEKFPVTNFADENIYSEDELREFNSQFNSHSVEMCWYAEITFYMVRPKTTHSFESVYKVKEYGALNKSERKYINTYNAVIDNGKILSTEQMTVTITEEDWKSYNEFYDWDCADVHYVKSAQAGYLPDYFTSVIKEMYKRKSVLKRQGLDETIEYILAKAFVNGLYGLCVQKMHFDDILFDPVAGWSQISKITQSKINTEDLMKEYEEFEDAFDKMYHDMIKKDVKDKQGNIVGIQMRMFLNPYWGIWVTAYARRRILTAIAYLNEDAIYSDTDSVYFLNYEKHKAWFEEYNRKVTEKNKKLFGKDFNELGDLGTFDPVVIKGENRKFEEYSFMTFGAKRYIKWSSDYDIAVTVAGLPKKAMQAYAKKKLKKDKKDVTPENICNLIVNDFSTTLNLSVENAMKNTHKYNDAPHCDLVIDDDGNEELMQEDSSICIYPIGFRMDVNKIWLALAYNIQKGAVRFG